MSGVRTTCVDEMLVTLPIGALGDAGQVRKPGRAGAGACGLSAAPLSGCAGAADVSSAVRIRPVSTIPAIRPSVIDVTRETGV